MKLKKNIYKPNISFYKKFENFQYSNVKKGDYLNLRYLFSNNKRRGGGHVRVHTHTFLLFKKKRRSNSLTFVMTSLYKHEKVKFRFLITSNCCL